jgi:hypothetical protein
MTQSMVMYVVLRYSTHNNKQALHIKHTHNHGIQIRMCTRIANDMNQPVAFGTSGAGVNIYYCGKEFGMTALPGSNWFCGPADGPPCDSCKRFAASVPDNITEIARLRADRLAFHVILNRRDIEHADDITELQKAVVVQQKVIRELQAANKTGEERIRELEAANKTGEERIRELEAAGAGAGAEQTREEEVVLPRNEPEEAARETKRPRRVNVMTDEMSKLLTEWDLWSEESWLLEMGVFTIRGLTCMCLHDIKDRDYRLGYLVMTEKARVNIPIHK